MRWDSYVTPAIRNIVLVCTGVFVVQTAFDLFYPLGNALMIRASSAWCLLRSLTRCASGSPPPTSSCTLACCTCFSTCFSCGCLVWTSSAPGDRAASASIFLLTGIGAGCINVLVKTIIDPHGIGTAAIPTIGASGAIYGILLASAIVFPDRKVWLIPFPVQIPMKIYVLGAGAIEFFSTLGAGGGGDNVSHVTHLGGMLVGYLYLRRGSWFFRARNGITDWKRKRARRKFEVYMNKNREEPPTRPDRWVN